MKKIISLAAFLWLLTGCKTGPGGLPDIAVPENGNPDACTPVYRSGRYSGTGSAAQCGQRADLHEPQDPESDTGLQPERRALERSGFFGPGRERTLECSVDLAFRECAARIRRQFR